MKFAFYTNSISAHQLPLARELVARLGEDEYRYVYTGESLQGGGQEVKCDEKWVVRGRCDWLENCEFLLCGVRDVELMERRQEKGFQTAYVSERWFKPIEIKVGKIGGDGQWTIRLPGKLRMLVPGYRRMTKRVVRWLKSDPNAKYLAIGPWAKKDMLWLGVPEGKIIDWGYFVEEGKERWREEVEVDSGGQRLIRVLWVGRMLGWKRVDTIVKAVGELEKRGGQRILLTLVGDGPEKERLLRLAEKSGALSTSTSFLHLLPPQPLEKIREIMRAHDVYVLSSNAQEGWGAAVNEAIEEGMMVLGTYEAGASAALLPQEQLFHAGDWRSLIKLLTGLPTHGHRQEMKTDYTPWGAATRLMDLMQANIV